MNKSLEFALSKFSTIPHGLRLSPSVNTAASSFSIDLARLYHHYYTDSYGVTPPSINHANFEYLKFLSGSTDFRFLGDGPGASSAKKRNISYDMGQAFCRYFLYEFCGITYFAHMDKVLNQNAHVAFGGITIKRISDGDVPDYLCAKNTNSPLIGEAKGRFSNISFTNAEFNKWRDQFTRIIVKDKYGNNKKVKGYIVATKFSTENQKLSNKSKLFAEDPETIGDNFLTEEGFGLVRGCISLHYSRLLSKLGLTLLSESLGMGFIVPNELSFTLPVWKCTFPPLKGELFVGGAFATRQPIEVRTPNDTLFYHLNIYQLSTETPFFYGITLSSISILRRVCLGEWNLLSQIPELSDTEYRPSNLAWLRDGSISGSLEFFEFVGFQRI